ncbi:hypothetical protein MNBD_BACTEROID01-140 [hydrothermal vent metagenome]|uniref:Galactoside O-acetyltransferase n=1 Tax=hydrothermal vent metagenome TaxID=652676 RepID=A0A3B0TD02_9ZZZZ
MHYFIKKLISYIFLIKNHVNFQSKVFVERTKNITLGDNVEINYRSRIRSRHDDSFIYIGNNVKVREFVEINAKGNEIKIGDYCFIAKNCWIGGAGNIYIGSNTMVGISSLLVASDHDYMNIQVPYYDHSEIPKNIIIGENVWIGAGVIVLGGSKIGPGSVVSAGAVVKGSYPNDSLIAGIPACVKSIIKRNI